MKDFRVKVVSAKMGIAVCRKDFKDAIADLHDRDVKSSSSKIKDGDLFLLFFVEAVCESRSGRFGDNPEYIEPCNFSCIFCRLSLRIVEVGGNCDDSVGHLFTQIVFG